MAAVFPGTRRRRGERRRGALGALWTAPWRRSVLLGVRQPAAFLAVFATAVILACTSSSASLFLSSASSAAVAQRVDSLCPDSALPTTEITQAPASVPMPPTPVQYDSVSGAVLAADRSNGFPAVERRIASGSNNIATGPAGVPTPAVLYYSDRAMGNITKLTPGSGAGVWVPDVAAAFWHVRPGGTVQVGSVPVRVVGIYRDLKNEPTRPFWCSQTALYKNAGLGVDTFQVMLIFTDPGGMFRVLSGAPDSVTASWLPQVRLGSSSLQRVRGLAAAQGRVTGSARAAVGGAHWTGQGVRSVPKLGLIAAESARVRLGLRGPVIPIAIGGAVLALLLVGAAGSYWADRRRGEIRLLVSRGVGPVALGCKAVGELALPALLGTAAGWAITWGGIGRIGPSPVLDPSAPVSGLATAGVGVAAGLVLLAVVGAVRAAAQGPRRYRRGRRVLAAAPWELLILAAAGLCYLRLRAGHAISMDGGIATVNMLLIVYPLLACLGAAIGLARIIVTVLGVAGRRSDRWPTASFLALSRMTRARVATATVLVAACLPTALLVFSGALTASSRATVNAKAFVYSGARTNVVSVDPLPNTGPVSAIGTSVRRYASTSGNLTLGSTRAQLLIIHPATFARTAFWRSSFDPDPLPTLLRDLTGPTTGAQIPALVVPHDGAPSDQLHIGGATDPLHIIATPTAFPGLQDNYADLVIIADNHPIPGADNIGYQSELWTNKSTPTAETAMLAEHARTQLTISLSSIINTASYSAISWTFRYLDLLATLIGLIAIGGLLLYLAARQRARTLAYGLSRRMGLTRAGHLRSLLTELTSLLVTAYLLGATLGWALMLDVYPKLDIDTTRLPPPQPATPTTALAAAAALVILVTAAAAWTTQHNADKTNMSEVLRLGT